MQNRIILDNGGYTIKCGNTNDINPKMYLLYYLLKRNVKFNCICNKNIISFSR